MPQDAKKEKVLAGSIVGEDKKSGVIYVVHPVTKEQKKELSRKGRIIDARFMPKA